MKMQHSTGFKPSFPGVAKWCVMVAYLACFAASPVDVYSFADDEQKSRYKALIEEFRCPKCLNTNIAGSDAPIAQDLRRTVHRLVVVDGMTDQQVRDFLQSRYGDFVLYDPPFTRRTWLVWVAPVLLAILGFGLYLRLNRQAARRGAPALTSDDRDRIEQLLRDEE